VRIIDIPQGTEEWKAARAGKVTASRIADVLAKIKTGEASDRRDYRAQLVAEILTGKAQDKTFVNAEMQWGTDQEPLARGAYELHVEQLVDTVGLVLHPEIDRAAASPDGLVGKDGLVEIKCPKTATHLQYLLDGAVPRGYQPQMLWQMACCERAWCDFVSYDPRLPGKRRLFVKRLPRDDARIKEIEKEVLEFLASVDRMLETIERLA
jgi:putative phage-type endonuclease